MANLSEAMAAFVLGILPTEDLPGVAVAALESGHESRSLGILAGETPGTDHHELRALLDQTLSELTLELPTPLVAAHQLKMLYASRVATGELPPREGASLIVERIFREITELLPPETTYVGDSFGLARLVGLFYNYDDIDPHDCGSSEKIDKAIIEECLRISEERTA